MREGDDQGRTHKGWKKGRGLLDPDHRENQGSPSGLPRGVTHHIEKKVSAITS